MKTVTPKQDPRAGAILGVVLVMVVLVSFVGMGLMELAARDGEEASRALTNARAFWLAEAGAKRIVRRLYDGTSGSITWSDLGAGDYEVALFDTADPPYAVAHGRAAAAERSVRVNLVYLAAPYENAVSGGNASGTPWTLTLGGTGTPDSNDRGGSDIVNGNVFANGDLFMAGTSQINAAPTPNTYGLSGDAEVTGGITLNGSASISGDQLPGSSPREIPDLLAMDYPNNHTYDVGKIFSDLGISSGYLPVGHPLRDEVVMNPGNRSAECASTPGDDFFFEPRSITSAGPNDKTAVTPLDLGDGHIYYVDGDAWFNSHSTYGFRVDGQATIVSGGNIHISDNLKYKDSSSLLGLVALGEYDAGGNLDSGGNVYFGDPEFGTLFTVDAFMFAGDSFLYNTRANGGGQEEPQSGFEVFGNFAAINQVTIYRDWYEVDRSRRGASRRAAVYDPVSGQWKDASNGHILTSSEIGGLRHYRMKVTYDERIWNPETQPPGLPRGGGSIFGGMTSWEEV
ncbi:MAG: hypothetical protein HQ523_12560 [Lentisphaerae bacterium]|nr:hypothetical protein [Lentisphaerota bacterium]